MFDWQNIAALLLVALAAAYVARRVWRAVARKRVAGCGSGCTSCAQSGDSAPADRARPFVALDQIKKPS